MVFDLNQAAKTVVSELRELAQLTSNEDGAQRIAWTPIWDRAVEWFKGRMKAEGAEISIDAAHNVWAKIEGERKEAIVIGSHLDSVPNGGWLDGALGVVAGMGILRRYGKHGVKPNYTIYVVNWADEEGARFGYSCTGSSAVSGAMDVQTIENLRDNDGVRFADALKKYCLQAADFPKAQEEFLAMPVKGYLELHIEQAPLLEKQHRAAACVYGITGCRRQYITFKGQPSHSGSPITMRQDAFLAAAQASLGFREIGLKYDAYCTVGKVEVWPNVVTIVPGTCRISLDQRSVDPAVLDTLVEEARAVAQKAAAEHGVKVSFESVWKNPPTIFPDNLVALCREAVAGETGEPASMVSGPLHDAAEISKLVPAVMMFAMSSKGLSHCKEENTPDIELETAIRAFFRLADKVMQA